MKIIPVQPKRPTEQRSLARTTRLTFGGRFPGRLTFGGKYPSRRTFGGKFPSRCTFGKNLP
jgi:hypothetical protein